MKPTMAALAVPVLLFLTSGARAQDSVPTWQEPHGRYTIAPPAGWKLESNPAAASMKISTGTAWAIFETSSNNGEPLDVAQHSARQMQPMYETWNILNQGAFETARHHQAAGITVAATVTTPAGGQQITLLFVTQSAGGGHFVTMTSSVPESNAKALNTDLMSAFNSIRFAGE